MNRRAVIASIGALVGWGFVWFTLGSIIGYETDTGVRYGAGGGLAVMALAYGVILGTAVLAVILFAVLNWVADGGDQ